MKQYLILFLMVVSLGLNAQENRLKIGKQLQKSKVPYSTVLTDINNEQYYVQPGTNGQIYAIVNGVPTWINNNGANTDTRIQYIGVNNDGDLLWNVVNVITGSTISSFTTPGETLTNIVGNNYVNENGVSQPLVQNVTHTVINGQLTTSVNGINSNSIQLPKDSTAVTSSNGNIIVTESNNVFNLDFKYNCDSIKACQDIPTLTFTPIVVGGDTTGYQVVLELGGQVVDTDTFTLPLDNTDTTIGLTTVNDSLKVDIIDVITGQIVSTTYIDNLVNKPLTAQMICDSIAANCGASLGNFTSVVNGDGSTTYTAPFTGNDGVTSNVSFTIAAIPNPDGSETIINATGNVTVTGTGTIADPYVIGYTHVPSTLTQDPLTGVITHDNGSGVTSTVNVLSGDVGNNATIGSDGGVFVPASSTPDIVTTITNTVTGNKIADYTNELGAVVPINETITTMSAVSGGSGAPDTLKYTNETGITSIVSPIIYGARHDLRLTSPIIERGSDTQWNAKGAEFLHNGHSHLNGFYDSWVNTANGVNNPTLALYNNGDVYSGGYASGNLAFRHGFRFDYTKRAFLGGWMFSDTQYNDQGESSFGWGNNLTLTAAVSYGFGSSINISGLGSAGFGFSHNISATNSNAFGNGHIITAPFSNAFGFQQIINGNGSTGFGLQNILNSPFSLAVGETNTLDGATGYNTALGNSNVGNGTNLFLQGGSNVATGTGGFASGALCEVSGANAMARGDRAKARSYVETVLGSWSMDYTVSGVTTHNTNDYLFRLSNGLGSNVLSDALRVKKNGRTKIITREDFSNSLTEVEASPRAAFEVLTVTPNGGNSMTGVLLAPQTQAQRNAITGANLVDGLEIYCTDCVGNDTTVGVKQVYQSSTSSWKNLY